MKQQFEEAAAAPAEAAAPADPAAQLTAILVGMGLSAEQAQAVYQMALDLAAQGGAEEAPAETTEVAASKESREMQRLQRALSRARRQNRQLRREMGAQAGDAPVRSHRSDPTRNSYEFNTALNPHQKKVQEMMNNLLK